MQAIERNFLNNDLITITFVVGLLLIFFMKVYQPKYLLGYTIAFFAQSFIEKRAKNNTKTFSLFYILLGLFSITTSSILVYTFATPNYFAASYHSFFYILLGCALYFSIKNTIIYLLVNLFNLQKELNYLVHAKNGYLYTVNLLLFPFLIINNYLIDSTYFLSIILCLLLIFRVVLITYNNKNVIFRHIFYFILYFCALELAPLLILYKTIN